MTDLRTIDQMVSAANRAGQPTGYAGVRGDWYVVPVAVTRDSETLERANQRAAIQELERAGLVMGQDWDSERFGHWAVGWVDYLIVAPDAVTVGQDWEEIVTPSRALALAREWVERLEVYPVLDDDVWSQVEEEELYRTAQAALPGRWGNCDGLADKVIKLAYAAEGTMDDPGYVGVDQWWPSDDLIRRAYQAWRRDKRPAGAAAS